MILRRFRFTFHSHCKGSSETSGWWTEFRKLVETGPRFRKTLCRAQCRFSDTLGLHCDSTASEHLLVYGTPAWFNNSPLLCFPWVPNTFILHCDSIASEHMVLGGTQALHTTTQNYLCARHEVFCQTAHSENQNPWCMPGRFTQTKVSYNMQTKDSTVLVVMRMLVLI